MAIYSINTSGQLIELKEQSFASEDDFQRLVAQFPSLVEGEQITPSNPRRWLLIDRELGIPSSEDTGNRWSIDHLVLDQDAIPTFFELKRATDTRLRREVIGQLCEYAANATVYWPLETIRAKFEARCDLENKNADEELSHFLMGAIEPAAFWEKAEENLRLGKIRMMIVADYIPEELKRIVEFLNAQLNPAELLAAELKLYEGQGIRTLIPRVFGKTHASVRKTTETQMKDWSDAAFLSEFNPKEQAAITDILHWASSAGFAVSYGKGKQNGVVYLSANGKDKQFYIDTARNVGVVFSRMKIADATKRRMMDTLSRIEGVEFGADALERYWGARLVPIEQFADPNKQTILTTALQMLMDDARGQVAA